MSSLQALSARNKKLIYVFRTFLSGQRLINSSPDAVLFFEAACVFAKDNGSSKAAETLVSSSSGLDSLAIAVRSSLQPKFIKSSVLPFIKFLSEPCVKTLGDGHFLSRLIDAILVPPTFWQALLEIHEVGQLQDEDNGDLITFAWMCLEVASTTSDAYESHRSVVENLLEGHTLLKASCMEVRVLAQRITKILRLRQEKQPFQNSYSPGGRHDNDFANFREIHVYPSNDEVLSKEQPFLQRLDDVFETPINDRPRTYLDWLFRLLREDMLAELREDLQAAWGQVKGKRRPYSLSSLTLVQDDDPRFSRPFLLTLHCGNELLFLTKMSKSKREKVLENPKTVFKHNSLGALCSGSNILAFGTLVKHNENLAKACFGFQVTDFGGLSNAVTALLGPKRDMLKIFLVDTPTFAYEPILQRLQDITEIPLEGELLDSTIKQAVSEQPDRMIELIGKWQQCLSEGAAVRLQAGRRVILQGAQLESAINGLKHSLALIQGPPGTGKSLIGAAIVLNILRMTNRRVLVLSYTNHALDQFLEDLLDIGVREDEIVRLGSKSSDRTKSMKIQERLTRGNTRLNQEVWSQINALKAEAASTDASLYHLKTRLISGKVGFDDILDHLELSENGTSFWAAFQLSDDEDGYQLALGKRASASPSDLYKYWLEGKQLDKLVKLASLLPREDESAWAYHPKDRICQHEVWSEMVREGWKTEFLDLSSEAKELQSRVSTLFDESKRKLLQGMRVISCTTTGASMHQSIIKTAEPDVVIVEEAGEILEAHIVAALSPSVQQLILIGDHKQLKPKVNNYALTVEKGEGYDLNVSLFERLIKQGRQFTTLEEQHRSHPDISYFARVLAYEKLKDSPKVWEREKICGVSKRVVFVHHEHPEEEMGDHTDRREPGSRSKRNSYEAKMVLKTVKYLSQQGYKTENMVVLTPYLGQLALLREELMEQNDPYLNDMDAYELVRAGLQTLASSKVQKRPLRLSTIDNYQGEESDIVIASLARSNASGDIGFLYARERLVVLMSRARNGIILFGNMHTFIKSKKGHALWQQYFDEMKARNCIFDGLPVYCERHPDRELVLKEPGDFDQHCPDGGCSQVCGAQLSCGQHLCERRCHRLQDHTKTPCQRKVDQTCTRGHKSKVSCGQQNQGCRSCAREDEETRRRATRDLDLEQKRNQQQARYTLELRDLDDEIDHVKRVSKYEDEELDTVKSLMQKRTHLQALKDTKARADAVRAKERKTQPEGPRKDQSQGSQESTGCELVTGVKAEWEAMKQDKGVQNEALDKLMDMIGLERVKEEFMSVKSSIDLQIRQEVSLSKQRLSCSLLGNPGTGKTTVARLWAKFLTTIGAIPGEAFEETTGSKLASNGVKGCESLLEKIKNDGGGVLFIDEAYQLSSGNSPGSKAVLDFLLAEVENLRGKVVFVLAGYHKEMESFFAHNPGMPSRFPITMKFDDYEDDELLKIFQMQLGRKYKNTMGVEDGLGGLYARIVARRIGRGRSKEGFGNARAVENALDQILKRQANRIRRQRQLKKDSNDLFLTKPDLIGPEPSQALNTSAAWVKLSQLIGLGRVKQQLKVFQDVIVSNYERELTEEALIDFSLNRVFVGSPGTGKTTVAKLYGQILSELGFLSNGEVVVKNPSDFVGSVLGQSEAQTKGILASTVGKVLVIDEAYGLYGGASGADPYKTAVIDTIVAEVQSVPGDDRCVLLLGYQDQMQDMFQNVNPGLTRRFPMSSAFVFDDFDKVDMARILDLKLKGMAFKANGQAKDVAMEILERARNRPNFGNAGEVDILLGQAKENHQKRLSAGVAKRGLLEAQDFDEDYERSTRNDTNVAELFKSDVGRGQVVDLLQGYQARVRDLKALEMDPKEEIPFSFLFRGPPGTGKTTTAKKMGKVYYDMGFLATAEVVECSATDLIGQYVGQTGPKVQQLLDKALGKVLFIDEAYRLAGPGYAKEAVDELVDSVTKPRYLGRLIIILAGYVDDINSLLAVNPGMSSRFPEVIDFDPLSEGQCIELLANQLGAKKAHLATKGKSLNISCLENPSPTFSAKLMGIFRALAAQDGWASARDVKLLGKNIFGRLSLTKEPLVIEEHEIEVQIEALSRERGARTAHLDRAPARDPLMQVLTQDRDPKPLLTRGHTSVKTAETTVIEEMPQPDDEGSDPGSEQHQRVVRDVGVSDEIWEQLEKDKAAEDEREAAYQKLKQAELKAQGEARERIIQELIEERERRRREQAVKAKLQAMGRCPVGYHWIKQQGGYRCAGGSHWLNDEDVSRL